MNMALNKINLKKILARVFGVPENAIKDDSSPESIDSWDSFQSLIMFQTIEQESGADFDVEDLKNIKDVGDIKKLLDKYKINY